MALECLFAQLHVLEWNFFTVAGSEVKTILCLPWSVRRVNLEQHRWCFQMCFYSLFSCKTSSVVWLYLTQGIYAQSGERALWLGTLKKGVVTQCPWESPFQCEDPVSLNWIGIRRHWPVWQPTAGVKALSKLPKTCHLTPLYWDVGSLAVTVDMLLVISVL